MKNQNNVLGGTKAKQNGKLFEQFFLSEAMCHECAIIRIEDGCKTLGVNKLFRVRQAFDFTLAKHGMSAFIDTKTTDLGVFSKSKINLDQVVPLMSFEFQNCIAGYVVNFTKYNKVVFFKASILMEQRSLNPQDGVLIGDDKRINLDKLFNSQSEELKIKQILRLTQVLPKESLLTLKDQLILSSFF